MTNKKRVAKQRYSIEYRVEVDITDAIALEAAAIEHTKRMRFDPSDEEGLAEALEWARSGPGAALIELFDPDRSLDEIAGIEVGMSDLTTGELPRRNPYKGPGSRKYPDEKAQRDEAIERILAYSPLVEGIDYLFIDQEPDDDRTPAEKAKWEEQFTLMKGLLWHSSKRVIAQLFDDVVTLATTASVTASTMDETHVLCELPPQFARFYNLHFAQKFTAATIDVSHRLSAGWQSLGTIAEELAPPTRPQRHGDDGRPLGTGAARGVARRPDGRSLRRHRPRVPVRHPLRRLRNRLQLRAGRHGPNELQFMVHRLQHRVLRIPLRQRPHTRGPVRASRMSDPLTALLLSIEAVRQGATVWMRDLSEIPNGPGIYLVHSASGSWRYVNLDEPPVWTRVPGKGAVHYPEDHQQTRLVALGGGWRVGECGHLTFLSSTEPPVEVERKTSRILGIIAFPIEPV